MALSKNDTEAFFNTIPWCSRLLATPNTHVFAPPSRTRKPATNEDVLFADTLQTNRTINAALAFHPRADPIADFIPSLSVLLALGDGLDGWPRVLHGGIVATIIDEVMGTLLVVNAESAARKQSVRAGQEGGNATPGEVGAFTAELKVRYLAPVATPGVVLVETKILGREGRKIRMEARILQKSGPREEVEGTMVECSVGEALMIVPRGVKL